MKNSRFVYFDVGNTLVDCSKAFERAALKFNLKAEDINEVFIENHELITKGFLSPQQLWEKCIHKYGLKNAHDYNFLESWVSDYQPIHRMHELIIKIKPRYKVGLLSNIYKGMTLPVLLKRNLIPNIHYEQTIFSCDVGMMKPNADIYDLAHKMAKVEPNNIFLIDDKKDFLSAAKKEHWNTFLFNNKQRDRSIKEIEGYLMNLQL